MEIRRSQNVGLNVGFNAKSSVAGRVAAETGEQLAKKLEGIGRNNWSQSVNYTSPKNAKIIIQNGDVLVAQREVSGNPNKLQGAIAKFAKETVDGAK